MSEIAERDQLYKALLAASFLLMAAAVIVSYRTPATGYEMDIYRSTPVLFWVFLSIALFLSIIVTIVRFAYTERNALALASTAFGVILVAGLPLLRGYHHVGNEDMMTQFGWTMELLAGVRDPESLFYPLLHILTSTIALLTGLKIGQTFHLISLATLIVFFVFVPLCARRLYPRRGVVTLGLFVALFLLPINQVTTNLQPNPRTVALFLLPMVFFVLLYSILATSYRALGIVIVSLIGLLFAHPQYAVGLLFFLLMFTAVIWIGRTIRPIDAAQKMSLLLGIGLAYGLASWVWIVDDETFTGFVYTMVIFIVKGRETAAEIGQRGSSLTEIGGSLGELFVAIYLVPALFCILVTVSGIIVAKRFISQHDSTTRTEILYLAFLAGIVPFAVLAVFFAVTNRISHLFRFAAFAMAIVSILAPVSLHQAVTTLSRKRQQLLIPVVVVCLALSLLVMFPSPYIYNDSKHVSEAQFHGYETVFEYTDPTTDAYDYTRTPVYRYGHAVLGPAGPAQEEYQPNASTDNIPNHFNNQDLPGYYNESVYLAIPLGDMQRDVMLYDGFRFSKNDFAYLNQDPQIQKIHSNGDVKFYYVVPRSEGDDA